MLLFRSVLPLLCAGVGNHTYTQSQAKSSLSWRALLRGDAWRPHFTLQAHPATGHCDATAPMAEVILPKEDIDFCYSPQLVHPQQWFVPAPTISLFILGTLGESKTACSW